MKKDDGNGLSCVGVSPTLKTDRDAVESVTGITWDQHSKHNDQRLFELAHVHHPAGQRGSGQVDADSLEPLLLTILSR